MEERFSQLPFKEENSLLKCLIFESLFEKLVHGFLVSIPSFLILPKISLFFQGLDLLQILWLDPLRDENNTFSRTLRTFWNQQNLMFLKDYQCQFMESPDFFYKYNSLVAKSFIFFWGFIRFAYNMPLI